MPDHRRLAWHDILIARPALDSAWASALAIAQAQWGTITRRQLRDAGLSNSRIDRLVARGHLHRLFRGVYAVGHRAIDTRGRLMAVVLLAGPESMLGNATALWWWGATPIEPARIVVYSPTRSWKGAGVTVVRVRGLQPTEHRGLPTCPIERTLIDFAVRAPASRLRRAISEALYLGLTDVAAIEAELRSGLPGSAAVRAGLERHREGVQRSRSEREEAFFLICEQADFPLPRVNMKIAGREVDFVWPDLRLAVEIDGPGHAQVSRIKADRATEMALRHAGVDLIRYTDIQVRDDSETITAELGRELRKRMI